MNINAKNSSLNWDGQSEDGQSNLTQHEQDNARIRHVGEGSSVAPVNDSGGATDNWWNCLPVVDKTDSNAKPKMVFKCLPLALQSRRLLPRWVAWHWILKDKRWTKVPLRAKNLSTNARTDDSSTWGTAAEVERAVAKREVGVGYVLTDDADLVVLDLDNVIDPEGGLAAWAAELIAECGSYTELSPSGRGVKIFGLLSGYGKFEKRIPMPVGDLEIFHHSRRYIIVTGVSMAPDAPLVDLTAIVQRLMAQVPPPQHSPIKEKPLTARGDLDAHRIDVERALAAWWNPDDYHDWVRAALALHRVSWGKDVWLAWSEKSAKFDSEECEQKWLQTEPSSAISSLSILHRVPKQILAQWNGWRANALGASGAQAPASPFEGLFVAAICLNDGDKDAAESLMVAASSLAPNETTKIIDAIHIMTGTSKPALFASLGQSTE